MLFGARWARGPNVSHVPPLLLSHQCPPHLYGLYLQFYVTLMKPMVQLGGSLESLAPSQYHVCTQSPKQRADTMRENVLSSLQQEKSLSLTSQVLYP